MSDVFGLGKAVEKLMDPVAELVKKLAGPAADEVGLSLQDSVRIWRVKRQYHLFEKMNKFIKDAGFEPKPVALKILLPSLNSASVEEDEDLHTAWAALLANAADPNQDDSVLPCFPNILKELRSDDARFLSNLYDNVHAVGPYWQSFHEYQLEQLYPGADPPGTGPYFTSSKFQLALASLERIGILSRKYNANALNVYRDEVSIFHTHELTALGSAFVRACRPPSQIPVTT